MTGKHIEVFLVEGVPGGITTAEIAGWTGHVLAGPRSDLGDILKRAEAKRNGAHMLLGEEEEALTQRAWRCGRAGLAATRPNNALLAERAVLCSGYHDGGGNVGDTIG